MIAAISHVTGRMCEKCLTPVREVVMQSTGGRVDVDAEPTPRGTIRLVGNADPFYDGRGTVLGGRLLELAQAQGETLYAMHSLTCEANQR